MGKVLYMRKGETHAAPLTGVSLADIAEGSIVKLNENGSPVEFYVAKHDYESALNGAGRTLLVRKDCYDTRAWGATGTTTYADNTLDTWFNETYLALLDADAQEIIGTTQFYYTPSPSDNDVTILNRAVFALSLTEMGQSARNANAEGSALPIASALQIAYLDGTATTQWTRTCSNSTFTNRAKLFYLDATGAVASIQPIYAQGSRPCFTIPSTALFDEDTLEFKEVA